MYYKNVTTYKDRIIDLYENRKSLAFIANDIGISRETVRSRLIEWGIKIRPRNYDFLYENKYGFQSKSNFNIDFFENQNVVSGYWAGFIAADGHISKNSLIITLAEKDKDHLEQFKKDICYDGKIKRYKYINRETYYHRIELTCKKLVADLLKIYNITPRKTFTLQPPNLTDEEMIKAYIIGYIDGDGSIGKQGTNTRIQICGNIIITKWIKNIIDKCLTDGVGNIYTMKSIYSYRIQKKEHILKIKEIFCSLDVPKLNRKWKNL